MEPFECGGVHVALSGSMELVNKGEKLAYVEVGPKGKKRTVVYLPPGTTQPIPVESGDWHIRIRHIYDRGHKVFGAEKGLNPFSLIGDLLLGVGTSERFEKEFQVLRA